MSSDRDSFQVKYRDGINYEYREPPFADIGSPLLPRRDQLPGTYDVVLHTEHCVGDRLTTVRGGTLVVHQVSGNSEGGLGFDVSLDRRGSGLDDDGGDEDEDEHSAPRSHSFASGGSFQADGQGGHFTIDAIVRGDPKSLVRIVGERTPLALRCDAGFASLSGEDPASVSFGLTRTASNDVRCRVGEDLLTRYRNASPHWLHSHTPLPTEVVAQILRYWYPPPVWFYEVGDLWIEGTREESGSFPFPSQSRWRNFRYVARRRNSDQPAE